MKSGKTRHYVGTPEQILSQKLEDNALEMEGIATSILKQTLLIALLTLLNLGLGVYNILQ